jgi:dTDP-4-dehydrorhamnose 3,5-epimerase
MRIHPTPLQGVLLLEPTLHADERGSFARIYCPDEFAALGLDFVPRQVSIAHNGATLTLRGMHYCGAAETKLVRCVRGRIFDVVVDIRPHSPSYRQWHGCELDPLAARAMLIPEGVAHGYLTLEAASDVLYFMDRPHDPVLDRGFRWNDPRFGIRWPAEPNVIHPRDAAYPDFEPA